MNETWNLTTMNIRMNCVYSIQNVLENIRKIAISIEFQDGFLKNQKKNEISLSSLFSWNFQGFVTKLFD